MPAEETTPIGRRQPRRQSPVIVTAEGSTGFIIALTRIKHAGVNYDGMRKFTLTKLEAPLVIKRVANLIGMKVEMTPLDEDGTRAKSA